MANITVTEDTILDGNQQYTPRAGEKKGIRYEVKEGIQVYLHKVTPEMVDKYDALALKPDDPNEQRTSHQVTLARCKDICWSPDKFDWKGCSMKVLWRISEDFLFLSSPTLQELKTS